MDNPSRDRIVEMSHEELYDAVKSASSTEGKLDMFLAFFWKVTMNDIHSLECDVRELRKFQGRLVGVLAAVVFAINLLVPVIVRVVERLLGWAK